MKKALILPSLLVVTSLLTSACTPADKAVTDSKTRQDLQAQMKRKAGGGGAGGQSKSYRLGGYQGASLLMDKQIEAIELVRLALQMDDGTKSGAQKKEKVESADGYKAILSLNSAPLRFSTGKGDFESKTNKNLNVVMQQEAGQPAWNLKIASSGGVKQTLDRKSGEKGFVNLFENSFEVLAATKSDEQKDLTIELKSAGDINGRSGQDSFKETFELKLTVVVDKASLPTDSVKIVKVNGELAFRKPDGSAFKITIEGKSQELAAEGLCNTLVGLSSITSDRSGKKIEFSKDQMSIVGTNFKMDLAQCGQRPTVDLSRLLP